MMKRTLLTFFAAAAISGSAMTVPAMVTPAAAANLDVSIGVPGAVPFVGVAPAPAYYAWGGGPNYWRWQEHRAWEHDHWWREHHYYR